MTAFVEAENLTKTYTVRSDGKPAELTAVDGTSFTVMRDETLGLVGESGCGKSSLARLLVRLDTPTAGRIRLDGKDIAHLSGRDLKAARSRFQMIFQDPYASLNPRMTARASISEPLRNYRFGTAEQIAAQTEHAAAQAGLSDYHLDRYPHELSGGQAQRVGIARAIALSPELIVADEPVSALDVSIQAQVINLIAKLREELKLTMVFISHDLSVVAHTADRVAVMYLGRIVELAPAQEIFRNARHPYTQALIASVPKPHPREGKVRRALSGELPSPTNRPRGCHFHTRCPFATDLCRSEAPALQDGASGHAYACHHGSEIPPFDATRAAS